MLQTKANTERKCELCIFFAFDVIKLTVSFQSLCEAGVRTYHHCITVIEMDPSLKNAQTTPRFMLL